MIFIFWASDQVISVVLNTPVFPKIGEKKPKMNGENNGSKPY